MPKSRWAGRCPACSWTRTRTSRSRWWCRRWRPVRRSTLARTAALAPDGRRLGADRQEATLDPAVRPVGGGNSGGSSGGRLPGDVALAPGHTLLRRPHRHGVCGVGPAPYRPEAWVEYGRSVTAPAVHATAGADPARPPLTRSLTCPAHGPATGRGDTTAGGTPAVEIEVPPGVRASALSLRRPSGVRPGNGPYRPVFA